MRVKENSLNNRMQHIQMWESVLSTLRMAIIKGQLQSGEHLLEVQLAEKLGVSRGPVREALVHLEHEGLVVSQPYRGKFVADISAKTIHETYSLRRLLESFAAELAIDKLDQNHFDRLHALFKAMMDAVYDKRFEEFANIDLEFHRMFVAAAGHTRLLQMWETLTGVTHAFIVINASLDHEGYRIIAEGHQAILHALIERDVVAVKEMLNFHLLEAERRLLQVMEDGAFDPVVSSNGANHKE